MTNTETINGLKQLGFLSGWVVTGDEITVWENSEPQPTAAELETAAAQWTETADATRASAHAKLKVLGLTDDEIAALVGA